MPVIHVNKSARGPFGAYLQVHNHDPSLHKLKIKLQSVSFWESRSGDKPGIQQLFIPFHLHRSHVWNEEKHLINAYSGNILDLRCQLCSDPWILSPLKGWRQYLLRTLSWSLASWLAFAPRYLQGQRREPLCQCFFFHTKYECVGRKQNHIKKIEHTHTNGYYKCILGFWSILH